MIRRAEGRNLAGSEEVMATRSPSLRPVLASLSPKRKVTAPIIAEMAAPKMAGKPVALPAAYPAIAPRTPNPKGAAELAAACEQ